MFDFKKKKKCLGQKFPISSSSAVTFKVARGRHGSLDNRSDDSWTSDS